MCGMSDGAGQQPPEAKPVRLEYATPAARKRMGFLKLGLVSTGMHILLSLPVLLAFLNSYTAAADLIIAAAVFVLLMPFYIGVRLMPLASWSPASAYAMITLVFATNSLLYGFVAASFTRWRQRRRGEA
jgi:hypothetical protein